MRKGASPRYVAVIGGGEANPEVAALAYEVGWELARRRVLTSIVLMKERFPP